jgi:hypothetical protein
MNITAPGICHPSTQSGRTAQYNRRTRSQPRISLRVCCFAPRYVKGFYFSRAVDADSAERLLVGAA